MQIKLSLDKFKAIHIYFKCFDPLPVYICKTAFACISYISDLEINPDFNLHSNSVNRSKNRLELQICYLECLKRSKWIKLHKSQFNRNWSSENLVYKCTIFM